MDELTKLTNYLLVRLQCRGLVRNGFTHKLRLRSFVQIAIVHEQLSVGKENVFACAGSAKEAGANADVVNVGELRLIVQ